MGKNPAFQFYPMDWQRDTMPLSLEAKGAWADILCGLWWADNKGTLTLPLHAWARLMRTSEAAASDAIAELVNFRICDSVTDCHKNVTLICRRMLREQNDKNQTRERQRRFRETHSHAKSNADITPVSSSSSSSLTSINTHNAGSSPAKVKIKKPAPEGYSQFVDYLCISYKNKKGFKYPFSAIDGSIVKKMLSTFDLFQLFALWDIFISQSWDWVQDGRKVVVPHDVKSFQFKLTVLLEDTSWKSKAAKHAEKHKAPDAPKIEVKLGKIPKRENVHKNKMDALKVIETN